MEGAKHGGCKTLPGVRISLWRGAGIIGPTQDPKEGIRGSKHCGPGSFAVVGNRPSFDRGERYLREGSSRRPRQRDQVRALGLVEGPVEFHFGEPVERDRELQPPILPEGGQPLRRLRFQLGEQRLEPGDHRAIAADETPTAKRSAPQARGRPRGPHPPTLVETVLGDQNGPQEVRPTRG